VKNDAHTFLTLVAGFAVVIFLVEFCRASDEKRPPWERDSSVGAYTMALATFVAVGIVFMLGGAIPALGHLLDPR